MIKILNLIINFPIILKSIKHPIIIHIKISITFKSQTKFNLLIINNYSSIIK